MGMDERRPLPGAAVINGARKCGIGGNRVRAVHFFEVKIGKHFHQPRDVAPGGPHFDRNRNRILVVLNQNSTGNPLEAVFKPSQNSPSLVVPSPSET